jgi:hypothetical protein
MASISFLCGTSFVRKPNKEQKCDLHFLVGNQPVRNHHSPDGLPQ